MTAVDIHMNLARSHFPVTGLGYGRRVGIWFQGCSIHCAGCVVPETWVAGPEHRTSLRGLLAMIQPWIEDADGVTVSGGEPFDQNVALHALLAALRVLCGGDLLVYSGYPWARLTKSYQDVISCCDVVVSEPFRSSLRGDEPFIGSSNQQLHALTPLARERYHNWRAFARHLDVTIDNGNIRLAGVPKPGQLQAICEDLKKDHIEATLTHAPV